MLDFLNVLFNFNILEECFSFSWRCPLKIFHCQIVWKSLFKLKNQINDIFSLNFIINTFQIRLSRSKIFFRFLNFLNNNLFLYETSNHISQLFFMNSSRIERLMEFTDCLLSVKDIKFFSIIQQIISISAINSIGLITEEKVMTFITISA